MKKFLSTAITVIVIAGIIVGFFMLKSWPMRFKSEFDDFFGKGNWEYLSGDLKRSRVYTVYHHNSSNPLQSGRHAGSYSDWDIAFTNRYGEEELWTVSNHVYKINHNNYRYNIFHPNRLTAKQALTQELMEISFEMVGQEVMNEIILDVLTEEEAACMNITMSYEGGHPKPKVYDALRKEPWFKANEITAADYLATDIYDFHLFIRVHDYKVEKLTEEQQQHMSESFEVIQEKLLETYGEHTEYQIFWGDGRTAEMQ